MDEPQTPTSPPAHEPPSANASRLGALDFRLIAVLALLTLGLRTYQICTTEVTARDGIGYIHIAWRLEHGDWRQVIPDSPQHPGYPIAVLAASLPARLLFPNDLPYAMQLGAQLASAGASILLTAPLFWLGVQLFNRRVAFWAVLLFQCLPCSGRIMADGLSEGVFLLFAATALALAMDALRSGSAVGFGLAGAASGLAYLTRPEGLLIPAAAAALLVALQAFARWRRPWRMVLAGIAAMACAVLVVGGPYMVLIGGLTKKTTPSRLLETKRSAPGQEGKAGVDGPYCSDTAPDAEIAGGNGLLAVWWYGDRNDPSGRKQLWALTTLAEVTSRAFFWVYWVPALAGLAWFRRRFVIVPGAWLPLLVCVVLAGLLFRVETVMGYLSDRHMILILLCGVPWAAAALDGAARRLAGLLVRLKPGLAGRWWAGGSACAACLSLAAAVGPLVQTLEPLHGDRAGFRQAGRWLAGRTRVEEGVFDPFGWAGYYAGRYFRQGDATNTPCSYVVLEEGGSHHSHLVTVPEAEAAARAFDQKWEFLTPRGKEMVKVVIYHLPVPWVTRPLP